MTKEEYQAGLAQFMKKRGPNEGTGFYGSMAWHFMMKAQFDEQLRRDGLLPPSDAKADTSIFKLKPVS